MKKTLKYLLITCCFTFYVTMNVLAAAWQQDDAGWRFVKNGSVVENGWELVDSHWYYFKDGYMQSGWIEENGQKFYLTTNGNMATGEVMIDGNMFTFSNTGALQFEGIKRDGLENDLLSLAFSQAYAYESEALLALDKLNQIRAAGGLAPVILDRELTIAATYRGAEMEKYNYFEHIYNGVARGGYVYRNLTNSIIPTKEIMTLSESSNGSSLLLNSSNINEINIAIQWLKNSPDHSNIMMNTEITKAGIGLYTNSNNSRRYTVILFTN